MIKALIFDCFGVLYPDPVFAYMRDPATPPEKAEILHALDEQAARGLLDKVSFISQTAQLLNITESDSEQQFFHSSQRNEQLVSFISELRKTYKVAMLSNIGGDMMDGFFSPEEQNELFDVVILSGNVKLAKPDRAIYELACDRLGVHLNEAVMIDDHQSNVDVAEQLGMYGICYGSFDKLKTELDTIFG